MVERLSLNDDSLISSYVENLQKHQFALDYCRGKRVLDAGCGTGYASHFLAAHAAESVLAVDISEEALAEANQNYRLNNLRFEHRDLEALADDVSLVGQFDTIVNFENLEHLFRPEKFVQAAAAILDKRGIFITSTPNGSIRNRDRSGKPINPFHVNEFTLEELKSLLTPYFARISFYGHWQTHEGKLRKLRARQLFEQLCESYYHPGSRIWRMIRRMAGKQVAGPPLYTGAADSFTGDYVILPLQPQLLPWAASTLIAVCEKNE